MAQASSVVLPDGQASPANVTFTPESVTPALSVLTDRSAAFSAGFRRLKVSSTFANGKSDVNRSKFTIDMPVVQSVNGVQTVTHTLRANVEYIVPSIATDAQRKDLHAFVRNGLANALIQGAMRDLDPLY